MRAGGNQPEDVFQRHLGKRQRGQGPVDRGDDHRAAGGQHRGYGGGEQPPVGNMLDHLGSIDDVEHGAAFGKRLGGHATIIDLEAGLCRMLARRLDRLQGGVDAGDGAAKPRHRLGQQPAAAADIKNTQPLKAVRVPAGADTPDAVQNIVDSHRREIMERGHRTLAVPPLR